MDKRIAIGVGLLALLLAAGMFWLVAPTGPTTSSVPEEELPAQAVDRTPVTAPASQKLPRAPQMPTDDQDEAQRQARREIRDALVEYAGLAKIQCEVPDTWTGAAFAMSDADIEDGVLTAAVDSASGVVVSEDGSLTVSWSSAEGGETNPCQVQPTYDVAVTFELDWVDAHPDGAHMVMMVSPVVGQRIVPLPDDSVTVSIPAGSMVLYRVMSDEAGPTTPIDSNRPVFVNAPPEAPSMTLRWAEAKSLAPTKAHERARWHANPSDSVSAGSVLMSRAEQQEEIGEHLSPSAAKVLELLVFKEDLVNDYMERMNAQTDERMKELEAGRKTLEELAR